MAVLPGSHEEFSGFASALGRWPTFVKPQHLGLVTLACPTGNPTTRHLPGTGNILPIWMKTGYTARCGRHPGVAYEARVSTPNRVDVHEVRNG